MEVANLSLTSNKCFPVLLKFDLHAYKNNKISFKRNNWITREFAKHTRWHSVSLDCILREVVLKKGLEINFSWKSRSALYTVSELNFMQITMFRKIYTSYVSQWIKSSNQCLFSTRRKQVTRFETNLSSYDELSLAFDEAQAVWLVGGEIILEQRSAAY